MTSRWLTDQEVADLTAPPSPVEGLVVAALLRQDSVTITPEAAAELARHLHDARLLRDVYSLYRLDAISGLHQPTPDRLCRECCLTSDDDQSEDCADLHDHSEGQPICATVAIFDADLDGA